MNYQHILTQQREFFSTQATKDISFRKRQLEKLKKAIQNNEKVLYEAIEKDFGKSAIETYLTEISFIYNEINYFLKNLNRLSKPKSVRTNLVNLPGSSQIIPEPLGCALIIGAWNYPYQLTICPMIAAMAAGNCCIIKPSEIANHTMLAMETLINSNFEENYMHVIPGGIPETTEVLKLRFDKIFFTGSTKVGQIVYEAAAKYLTPVALELGGKSPVIISDDSNFELAAKRIVWGKFLNAGQTCIAPDYILVSKKSEQKFLEYLKQYIEKFNYTEGSENYTNIINTRNFERLQGFINPEKIYFGGKSNAETRYLEPTILKNVTWDDVVMQEEIFGPILPVLTYEFFHEAINMILLKEKPLSAYLFSNSSSEQRLFTDKLSFGGGCINDVLMHISNENLPFGGVGNSGTGSYHGKFGFDTFSHQKAVLHKATWGEPNLKYPPYTEKKKKWLKKIN